MQNVQIFFARNLYFLLIFVKYAILFEDCPRQNPSGPLQFTVEMAESILASNGAFQSINCCASGFTGISWTFRRSELDNWTKVIPGRPELSNSNMTISFNFFQNINTGFYRCTVANSNGSTIENITKVVTGCSQQDHYMFINDISTKTSFYEHEKGKLCCTLSTFIRNVIPCLLTVWSYRNSTKDPYSDIMLFENCKDVSTKKLGHYTFWVNTTSVKAECFTEISTTTCVEFKDLRLSNSGFYQCEFQRVSEVVQNKFLFTVIPIPNQAKLYISILSIVGVFIFILLAVTWVFYYDLHRVYKKLVQSDVKCLSIDIVLFYDDQDITGLSTSLLISNILANKGFSTYLHDRDKKYGVDIYKEYLSVIADCNAMLFLFTPLWLENELLVFCLQNSMQFQEKRIFAFISSRKTVLKSLVKSEGNEQIYRLMKSFKNYNVWRLEYNKDSFMRRRFISWIISFLPYKPFIRAKENCYDYV